MKTLTLGFLIGLCAASLFWLAATDISDRFRAISERIDRHEQVLSVLVRINMER